MIIDDKGRLLGKLSIIDLFVFAVIASIIAFGIFKIGNSRGIGILEPMRPITMRLSIDALEDFTADFLRIGDPVANNDSNVQLGTVTNIERSEAQQFSRNSEGQLVLSSVNNFSHIEITTEFMGHEFENGVLVSGHTFLVGQFMVTRVGDTNIFFRISGISVE